MAAGDVIQEFAYRKRKVKLKTTTGCTKGDVLSYDTDGYAPVAYVPGTGIPGTGIGPYFVALQTVAAPASGQSEVEVLEEGVVEVNKVTGAIADGAWVVLSTTAGKVTAFTNADVGATYAEDTIQDAIEMIYRRVGRAYGAAASADTTVKIRLLSA